MSAAELLAKAQHHDQTPFDYIVVGSGAGGGPLAARLALEGKRVLVLEAGVDPAVEGPQPGDACDHPDAFEPSKWRAIAQVPAYHGPATEDPDISWSFSVRHFEDDTSQRADSKYLKERDPSANGGTDKGGILYPRSSALGGCTAHHAMIVVKPNDGDWNAIAERTGDESWGAGAMQGYFGRIESCLYYTAFDSFFRRGVGWVYSGLRKLLAFVNPRYQLDWGGHGFAGWQTTSFIDPLLILGIVWRDCMFTRVLRRVIWFLLRRKGAFLQLLRALARLRIARYFDPNFADSRGAHGQLAFIPIGTDGKRRTGLREHLLRTARDHSDRLLLLTGVLATRVIFDRPDPKGLPRAVGVEALEGVHLYEASPRSAGTGCRPGSVAVKYFARREVVLAGGAFNTPQLLMLSGIGEEKHLKALGIDGPRDREGQAVTGIVDLPGVGRNLQDRYEVSVISQTENPLATLDRVSFVPGDPNDPALQEWNQDRVSLYSTNGGALAVFAKSDKRLAERSESDPDLFIFGVPAAFRGYYWDWSKELLREAKGATREQRDLWSWVILKGYTRNDGGIIRLRSASACQQPEICFHSFGEGPAHADDLAALADGIRFVREMNGNGRTFKREIQPGPGLKNGSEELRRWIVSEAWGHHACGTCRMGSDRWRADRRSAMDLDDKGAVIDSRFRVHGVSNLRVVDASAFPRIPGYFIVTPVFMISEKAADVILADDERYPRPLQAAEAEAIAVRRAVARAGPASPANTVGLALSGGGIRSATYCLGFLQALARRNRLRGVDILSTVSGGGYAGSFLGRLFNRVDRNVVDKVGHVQEKLTSSSAELRWLRRHANYLSGEGRADLLVGLAVVWRNLLAVHIFIGILLLAAFSVLRWLSGETGHFWVLGDVNRLVEREGLSMLPPRTAVAVSPWWWLPLAAVLGAVAPIWCAFWIAPWPGMARSHPVYPLLGWIAAMAGGVAALRVEGALTMAVVAIAVLLLAWLAQEMAQWRLRPDTRLQDRGLIARNRLARAQAQSLALLGVTTAWFLLDSAARTATHASMMPRAIGAMALTASILPFLRPIATRLTAKGDEGAAWMLPGKVLMGTAAVVLALLLLVGLDIVAHAAFDASTRAGGWLLAVTAAISIVLGQASGFANLSSLQPLYWARLVRTFLGASSEARVGSRSAHTPMSVEAADTEDDVAFGEYHPESNGGPLHLINVCVNETTDIASGRPLRQDKGLSMCVGPCGVSVGQRYHSLWTGDGPQPAGWVGRLRKRVLQVMQRQQHPAPLSALRPIRVSSDPHSFHVLANSSGDSISVESLRLGQWMAISGAALSTGSGRLTSLPLSLLLGLLNARLGHWWNTHIAPGERPGRYPPGLWRRIKAVPGWVFRAQGIILNEWRSYFGGPSQRLWFLSDGGHFESSGLYELVRRRVKLMIGVDASQDASYHHKSTALLVRRARQDFGAEFAWVDIDEQAAGWKRLKGLTPAEVPPKWIQDWIAPEALGDVWQISRDARASVALARVTYADAPEAVSWLLLVKAGALTGQPLDVTSYSRTHPSFPHESTFDQFLDDDQWECYRVLGERAGLAALCEPMRP